MTKDVEVLIRGSQSFGDERDGDPMVVSTKGVYRMVGGKHHLAFDEIIEGTTEKTRNHIILEPDRIEVRKSGEVDTVMVFEEGHVHETRYKTAFGALSIHMKTKKLTVRESDDALLGTIWYTLMSGSETMAECTMEIKAKSKA